MPRTYKHFSFMGKIHLVKLRPLSPTERKLFIIRFSVLAGFAGVGLLLGLVAKEVSHISLALVGMKLSESVGEALSEAIAFSAEEV